MRPDHREAHQYFSQVGYTDALAGRRSETERPGSYDEGHRRGTAERGQPPGSPDFRAPNLPPPRSPLNPDQGFSFIKKF